MVTRQQTPAPARTATLPAMTGAGWLQRQCGCGGSHQGGSSCASCEEKKKAALRRSPIGLAAPTGTTAMAPPIVREALRSPGTPLAPATRTSMERYFGHDFSQVRVHAGAMASASARAVNALAYTVGRDIVFGSAQYSPDTLAGRRLLAHELTHVVQQRGSRTDANAPLVLGDTSDAAESEAERAALAAGLPRPATTSRGVVQRQFSASASGSGSASASGSGTSGGGGATGAYVPGVAAAPEVCSRDLQGVLGYIGNHAYIEAPPFRYAIISPLCGTGLDNPITGTTAQKWDNSPDPCGKTPKCLPCTPAPGVTDVNTCLRSAFSSYAALSLYRGLGPNSNTFAGTLARTCCAGMVPKPSVLGNCPGWDDPPASARAGATPCPPGPTC